MTFPRTVLLAMLMVIAVPSRASADEAGMRSFVAQVLARNPALRAGTLAHASLRAKASSEGYWPDPELSVMLDQVPGSMDGEMPMVRYQLNQMIMWPGKLRLMAVAADEQAQGAAADVDVLRLELIRNARQGYLMLVQNRGYREVNEATSRLLELITNAAVARYGAGTGGHHEVARAEVERSALEVEALSLEGERVSILAMLNALRARPPDAALDDASASAAATHVPEMSALVRSALERRPELKKMRAMIREETTMAALARRERYPDVMTGVWYNQTLGSPDTVGVMVGTTIPLFSVPRQNRRAEASELSAQSVRSDVSGMLAMIRYQIADADRRVQTAKRTLELVIEVARPRAEQSFGSALSGYSAGSADMVFVLDAWRALQRMEQARIDAVVAQRMALIDLEWAIGGPIQGAAR